MLTKQHRFATSIINPLQRQEYRQHMCGVCHTLGDNYGLLHRLFTSQDIVLLNLLVNSQMSETPKVYIRHCPLNPQKKVSTNNDSASHFSAAIAVELTVLSIADDIRDSKSGKLVAYLTKAFLAKSHSKAVENLETRGFQQNLLVDFNEKQVAHEADPNADPSEPTQQLTSYIFETTAFLAKTPENSSALSKLGRDYGKYLYLADAYRDFAQDMAEEKFNPLRQYSTHHQDKLVLSQNGLQWLLDEFCLIQADMQAHLDVITFKRYSDLVKNMIIQPVTKLIDDISAITKLHQELSLRRVAPRDMLKAASFVALPIVTIGIATGGDECGDCTGDTGFCMGGPEGSDCGLGGFGCSE